MGQPVEDELALFDTKRKRGMFIGVVALITVTAFVVLQIVSHSGSHRDAVYQEQALKRALVGLTSADVLLHPDLLAKRGVNFDTITNSKGTTTIKAWSPNPLYRGSCAVAHIDLQGRFDVEVVAAPCDKVLSP
jgi:hypothetical protein